MTCVYWTLLGINGIALLYVLSVLVPSIAMLLSALAVASGYSEADQTHIHDSALCGL